jgi:heat shock protein HtpX
MQYVGLDKQIRKNNFNSILLLVAFPLLLLGMVYVLIFFTREEHQSDPNYLFTQSAPFVLAGGYLVPGCLGWKYCYDPARDGKQAT